MPRRVFTWMSPDDRPFVPTSSAFALVVIVASRIFVPVVECVDADVDAALSSPAASAFGAITAHAVVAAIAIAMPARIALRRRNPRERACSGNAFIVTSFRRAGIAGG